MAPREIPDVLDELAGYDFTEEDKRILGIPVRDEQRYTWDRLADFIGIAEKTFPFPPLYLYVITHY